MVTTKKNKALVADVPDDVLYNGNNKEVCHKTIHNFSTKFGYM